MSDDQLVRDERSFYADLCGWEIDDPRINDVIEQVDGKPITINEDEDVMLRFLAKGKILPSKLRDTDVF